MTVLVAAASEHGATREIAARIADDLAQHGIDVEVNAPEEVDERSRLRRVRHRQRHLSGAVAQTSNELHRSPPRRAAPEPNLALQQRPDRSTYGRVVRCGRR